MKNLLKRFAKDESGATAVEYSLVAAGISVAIIAVMQGLGLEPALYPSIFALARHAGWTAHAIEQVSAAKLIRPDMRYTGPAERDLPA